MVIRVQKQNILILFILFTALFCSCNSTKDVVYIQGSDLQSQTHSYEATIKPGDRLSIIVNSPQYPELAQQFNMQLMGPTLTPGTTINLWSGAPQPFEVNAAGCISYPYIGTLQVTGMTRKGLEQHITKFLQDEGYIKDPVVIVRFLDRQITVLGEVNRPGVYKYENDYLTLFEALSLAGDLTIYGERHNIKLIRETDGKTTTHVLDITDRNILKSPYFILQQNDQIYVEPIKVQANNRIISALHSFALQIVQTGVNIGRFIQSAK